MNRLSLVQAANRISPVKEEFITLACREFFNVLTESLARGDSVELRGAMTLTPVTRASRPALNPRTGAPMCTLPHKTVWATFPARVGKRRVTRYPMRDEAVKAVAEPFYAEIEKCPHA